VKLPISLVVITLNEERNLARCLGSCSFADEVIVVDSFSSDQTVEVAKKLGAKVIQQKWLGYGAQKNFANSHAKNDWILSLDADEALSPELATEIQNHAAKLNPKCAYRMPRLSFYLGRWIRHGGWYPDWQIRLFHKQHSSWDQNAIHEKLQAEQIVNLQNNLLHFVFKDKSHQVLANDRYSTLQAKKLFEQKVSFRMFKLIFKPIGKFIECYFLKLGFLDGMPGFLIAVSAGYSMFLKWSKLWELEQKNPSKQIDSFQQGVTRDL
jgi:glycosyltransferase involved in cell wall biosynthesis